MIESVEFVCYCHPEPQGSSKGFPIRRAGGKMGVVITSSNSKLKPFRHAIAQVAQVAVREAGGACPVAGKHVPVRLELDCYFQKPASTPKSRLFPAVKPDADKLARSVCDALTGILFADDAQVVELTVRKHYGVPERVEVKMRLAATEAVSLPSETLFPVGSFHARI